jgi:hypothetical protein
MITNLVSRRRALRRRAAELVLDDPSLSPDTAGLAPDLAAEIDGIKGIAQLLENVPASAWPAATERPQAARAGAGRARFRPAPALAAALACLVVAFLAGSLIHPTLGTTSQVASSGRRVILAPLAGQPTTAHAVAYVRGADRIVLQIEHLPPSPRGTYYELWLMTNTTRLVPVAGFRVPSDGRTELTLGTPDQPVSYRYLDISLQHVGDGTAISPTSVLRGPLS